jgi:hypothetical protein
LRDSMSSTLKKGVSEVALLVHDPREIPVVIGECRGRLAREALHTSERHVLLRV